ncbi:MAG: hypothetical protein EOO65_05925 [Methanosarcinales archaeon]|nr:MAG: hypothetical protein EOO65_05925 [Methanosarcinales archaeon]
MICDCVLRGIACSLDSGQADNIVGYRAHAGGTATHCMSGLAPFFRARCHPHYCRNTPYSRTHRMPMQADYDGPKSELGSLEQFFYVIGDIPRYEQRLLCMLFRLRLDPLLTECRSLMTRMRAAVDALRNSTSLRGMLEVCALPRVSTLVGSEQ